MKDLIGLLEMIFPNMVVAWLVLFGLAVPVIWIVYKFFFEGIRDSRQKYYDLKLRLCTDAAKTVAKISTSTNGDEIRKAAAHFDELYWGELVLVESSGLETAMVQFRSLITVLRSTEVSPDAIAKEPKAAEIDFDALADQQIDRNKLRSAALKVARACFTELQPRWVDLVFSSFRSPTKE